MDNNRNDKSYFYSFLSVNRPPFRYSSFDNCSSFPVPSVSLNVDGWSIASPFSRSFSFFSSEFTQKSLPVLRRRESI